MCNADDLICMLSSSFYTENSDVHGCKISFRCFPLPTSIGVNMLGLELTELLAGPSVFKATNSRIIQYLKKCFNEVFLPRVEEYLGLAVLFNMISCSASWTFSPLHVNSAVKPYW